jgi:hypothetical protein
MLYPSTTNISMNMETTFLICTQTYLPVNECLMLLDVLVSILLLLSHFALYN